MVPRSQRFTLHLMLTVLALLLAAVAALPGRPAFAAPAAAVAAAEPIDKHPEWDQEYTRQIRAATTGPEFMTDLVDHLPSSATVPSPLKVNGYIAGAPDHLTYVDGVNKYMRALEAATPRLKVFPIGKSEEGREMILVAIADEDTIRQLDTYRDITRKLSDPRQLSDDAAAQLIKTGKPMYYITGAMHSPETGSPEMLMELAYRLVVEDTPWIRAIRSNTITLITPVLETDGRDRMVDITRWRAANPGRPMPPLAYWGHYVAHDNNRDAMGMALNLSRNVEGAYFGWHPQVIHDLHESIPFLYVSTGTGPYNPSLDPLAVDEWTRMAYNEVQTMTAKGLVGVWTHGFYDGWAPNYMFWIAHGHNSLGRFYETFGNLVPTTEDRVVGSASQRDWYRPNPPYPKVRWSLRDNTNYEETGILTALKYMADNREHLLDLFWTLGKRSIAKATTEGPAAYVFPADQKRRGQLRDLLNLLQSMGIEVQQTDRATTVDPLWPPKAAKDGKEAKDGKDGKDAKDGKEAKTDKADAKDGAAAAAKSAAVSLPAGSFVIRMDQPYSRLADTLLDIQYVLGKEEVYDDTGWTLGYTKNVDVHRIVNQDVLKVPMHMWDGKLAPPAATFAGKAIAIRNHADTDLIRLRWQLPSTHFAVLDEEWKRPGGAAALPAGTVVIEASDEVRSAVRATASLDAEALDAWPSAAKSHDIPMPRVAILHSWIDTQDEGWFRLAFESLKVPYTYLSTQSIGSMSDLRSRFDVIVFPPAGGDPEDIVNGLPPGPPLPWRKTALTPNLGGIDETDDMRPGLGLAGVQNLTQFVENGGLLITVRDTATWAVNYGLARWVSVVPAAGLKARGAILRAHVNDAKSPVAWGYDDTVPVQYTGSPVFRVGQRTPRPDRRLSGRGSATDPDVPQGRPFVPAPEHPKPGPGEEGFQAPEDFSFFFAPYLTQVEDRPRVILSFPKEADKILLSGMLEGGDEIAGAPVVIDSPRGKGHVLLFACNPMWRQNTQGDFALIFNAIENATNLGLGWPPAGAATTAAAPAAK